MDWSRPPDGRPWGLIGLCGSSLLLNVILIATLASRPETPPLEVAPVAEAAVAVVASPTAVEAGQAEAPTPEPAELVEESAPVKAPSDVQTANMVVEHSLARTFQHGVSESPDAVSAVYARLFAWELDLRRDLQKGDAVSLAWTTDSTGLPDVVAASYRSNRHKEQFTAYKFHASGDTYPSWWSKDGRESARVLKDSPIDGYEQITALLKDRPSHRGMDFKAPVGTPITSPRSGVVTRTNWNTKYNGGCVEVKFSDGVTARFLHLSQVKVDSGQKVSKGTTLALSGNTGRSTAPHLHYEMDRNGKILDPVDYHGVIHRTLDDSDMARFAEEMSKMSQWLEG